MPGNKSRYSVENKRPYQEVLRLYGVPSWFSLEPYKNARKWNAARWLIEIARRRMVFVCYEKSIREGSNYYLNRDILIEGIEGAFNELSIEYSDPIIDEDRVIHNAGQSYAWVFPREALIQTLDCKSESMPIPGLEKHSSRVLVCRDGPEPVLQGAPAYSVVAVDLNAPNKDITDAFSKWLEKERKRKNVKQPVIFGGKERTSHIGPKPSLGEKKLPKLADNYYLAYWDLRLLIQLADRPLPPFRDWLDLLAWPDPLFWNAITRNRKPSEASYIGTAEWLLTDEARGLLNAEAEADAAEAEAAKAASSTKTDPDPSKV